MFLYETRDINTYPSIMNTIRICAENNYSVDVFIPSHMKTLTTIDGVRFIVVSESSPFRYIKNATQHIKKENKMYDLLIVSYYEGLIISALLNRNRKKMIPTIYFSMELLYGKYYLTLMENIISLSSIKAIIAMLIALPSLLLVKILKGKLSEKSTIRKWSNNTFFVDNIRYSIIGLWSWVFLKNYGGKFVAFSIIQDIDRGRILMNEFNFVDKIFYIPNSYIGFSEDISTVAHEKFNIPYHKKIILYTGGIERGFDLALFDVSKRIGSEYVIFFNSYSRDNYLSEILPLYENEIEKKRLIFNQINLSEDDYDLLVKSSHICIAWYPKPNRQDLNMYFLCCSSGKLMKYLACGKPVIAPDYFANYQKWFEVNQLGKTCSNAGEIPRMIEEIEKDYPSFQRHIKKYYLESLEFRRVFQPVLKELGSLCDQH